ncbi:MAG: hypothetical protein CMC82_06555 [Flavobacteriaceae bacterium]|nr:hypothetical protein [Flavobacteriaceae bacterium]|tara:strand:- start:7 stop:825 length:819 start_codon:yes stop_codon:yes gene_type:complete
MKKIYTIIALLFFAVGNSQIVITGLMDGDLAGGNPKVIELYVNGTIDLSEYSLWRSSNGGAFASAFDLSGTFTDRFVYLGGTSNGGQAQFEAVFGTAGVFSDVIYNSKVNGNGDDGFQIVKKSDNSVIDQVWTTDTNDSYKDSYMKRKNDTGPDGDWVPENWTLAGNGILDTTDAANHATVFAAGTYTNSSLSSDDRLQTLNINIYPNPTETTLNFSGINVPVQASVFDMLGKLHIQTEVTNTLDVSALKPGLYMVEIKSKTSSKVFKVLKQ